MSIKKFLILLAIIMVCFTIYKIVSTYALFESSVTKSVMSEVGKWKIKINSADITNSTTKNFTMNTFNISKSQYTKDNKIAPGMSGNFEIEIEPQNTQVSIRYDITIDSEQLTNKSIKLDSVAQKNNNSKIIKTAENTYTGVIPLEKINEEYMEVIEISFSWDNIEENNEEDSKIGTLYNSNLEIPISVHLSQYLGENIEEFNPNW